MYNLFTAPVVVGNTLTVLTKKLPPEFTKSMYEEAIAPYVKEGYTIGGFEAAKTILTRTRVEEVVKTSPERELVLVADKAYWNSNDREADFRPSTCYVLDEECGSAYVQGSNCGQVHVLMFRKVVKCERHWYKLDVNKLYQLTEKGRIEV